MKDAIAGMTPTSTNAGRKHSPVGISSFTDSNGGFEAHARHIAMRP